MSPNITALSWAGVVAVFFLLMVALIKCVQLGIEVTERTFLM